MIIGICGRMGSGKNAASEYLHQQYNFQYLSFADSLKYAISNIFGWDFELLQGRTPESRKWREEVDIWWSNRLNIPNLTPRWILQQWGTEVGRNSFHQDIWLASLERKLINLANQNIVIDDCRFVNEIETIKNQGGIVICINRGKLPIWYETAKSELNLNINNSMQKLYPKVHISEWGWINQKFDHEIDNNGTIDELHFTIDKIIKNK
jgi:hypothetical protein